MNYIRKHWQGELSLGVSFWINFLLLLITLNALERFVFPPYIEGEMAVTNAVLAFSIVVRLIIYPWQVVGVIRACDRSADANIDRIWVVVAQGVVVMSIVASLVLTFSSYQSVLAYKKSFLPPETFEIKPRYTFELVNNTSLVHLRGPFQPGITRRFSEFIDKHPQITGVILDSRGGQISEGRGLARVIREGKLNTYCTDLCTSACTTSFAAGVKRTLSRNAKLGFHQYKSFTVYPNFDIEEEQAKDAALFREKGISADFLQKIFAQPPEDMWWPEHDELLRANFIHQSGFSLDAGISPGMD